MRKLSLVAAVTVFLLGLSGCAEMEEFYTDVCTGMGGVWAGSKGCKMP